LDYLPPKQNNLPVVDIFFAAESKELEHHFALFSSPFVRENGDTGEYLHLFLCSRSAYFSQLIRLFVVVLRCLFYDHSGRTAFPTKKPWPLTN